MAQKRQYSRRQRVALRLARYALWPIAKVHPSGSWGRLHARLCELDGHRPVKNDPNARVSPPMAGFLLLLGAALVLWLHDVFRRPSPPEPTRSPAHLAAPRR